MTNEYEDSLRFWQKEIKEKGVGYLRKMLPQYHGDHQEAGYEVVSKFEEKQSSERHNDLIKQGQKMLTLQRNSNIIQWGVLGVLIVTVIVTIAIAYLSKSP